MKVLLLQPPVEDFYNTDIRLQPIGLAYLKAVVEKHLPEISVILKDYHHGWGRRTIPLPRELSYLRDYYAHNDRSPFSTFHHYYHFGADFDAIAEAVAKEKPDLVGIASLFAPYSREVLHCAEAIKARYPVLILLGGAHVSAMPEAPLAHPAVDFIIRGEGEKPFVEFLKALQGKKNFRNVPNLGYKKRGRLILNPLRDNFPIETLPFPALSGLPRDRYTFEKKPLCFIITSRGCPYRCAFCSVHKTFGYKRRRRSAENILTEIRERYAAGYRVFDFEDDHFAFDGQEMKTLCKKIIEDFPKQDLQLLAMNGVCYWTLKPDILRWMRRAGFTHLNLSLVSTNSGLLKKISRPHALDQYQRVVRKAATLGFRIVAYQILGLPGDTPLSMIKTLVFNARLPVLLGASPFYLIPGTPIAGHRTEPSDAAVFKARLTAMAIETKDFKREDLYTLFIATRILNFLKGVPLSGARISLSKALAAAARQDSRSALGVEIFQRLMKEKILFAATEKGLEPLVRFKPQLFFQLWQKLDTIRTQQNVVIQVRRGVLC